MPNDEEVRIFTLRASVRKPTRWVLARQRSLLLLGCVLFLAFTNRPCIGQEPASGGLNSRQAIAVNRSTGKAYATEPGEGLLAVIDGKTHSVTEVKVGKGPVAVVVNAATNKVYVANHDSGSITVIDGKSDSVLATVPAGRLPYSMTVDEVSNTVYVSNVYSQVLTLIDGGTNRTTSLKAGSADAMIADAAIHRVYLLGYEATELTLLDTRNHEKSLAPMGRMHQWGMALNPSNHDLFITQIGDADVVQYNGKSGQSSVIKTGQYPCAVAINSKTNKAYVVNYLDNSVTVVDAGNSLAVTTVKVGERPQAVAIDETTDRVYVANSASSSVTVIDAGRNRVLGTLKAGIHPFAIVVDSHTKMAYVANSTGLPFTQLDIGHELQP